MIRSLCGGGYEGHIYPVNPRYEEVQGLVCYPDLESLPESVDLAVMNLAGHRLEAARPVCEHLAYSSCFNQSKASDIYKQLNEVLIIDGRYDHRKIQKMALDRFATGEEKGWLLDFLEMNRPCRQIALEGSAEMHPLFVSMFASWFAENDETTVAIIQDEITLGDANRTINRRGPQRQAESIRLGQGITQGLEASHQQQEQQRVVATGKLQQWLYQQQLLQQNQQYINSLYRPRTTQCQYVGYQLQCTTF